MGWFPVATDYDAPRKTEEDIREESLEELKARRADKQATMIDEEETEIVDLPGADLSDQSLTARVVPQQADEFTCSECFLVQHRSQLVKVVDGQPICSDCA